MGEIVQIFVGQAGVQIANACWELYCLENGICADGTLTGCPYDDTFKNIFYFKSPNQVVPRTILVDSDPIVIDQIQRSAYGCLYNPACLICGNEDSGCLYPRGYGTIGSELIDLTMEAFHRVVESCCHLRGILIFRSIGGGTGSGLGNLILDRLMENYSRVSKMEFIIFPSASISPLTVEPYNAMLATHLSMDAIDCSFIMDNGALFDICAAKLNKCAPRYQNLNRIIAQVSTTFTSSQRFGCHSDISFAEYQTNLVPYPRIHFPVVSYAPFIAETGVQCSNVSTEQITNDCFEPCNQLVRCDPKEGNFMSCLLLYRGNVTPACINASTCRLRRSESIHFVDWQPRDFKIGINTRPPFTVPSGGLGNSDKAVLALSSNTAIQRVWCRLVDKFKSIYCIRAYMHHYIAEGMEEDAFREALEDITALIADYKEVEMCLPDNPNPCLECGIIKDSDGQCACNRKVKASSLQYESNRRSDGSSSLPKEIVIADNLNLCVLCGLIKDCNGQCGCERNFNGNNWVTTETVIIDKPNLCIQCGIIKDSSGQCGCNKKCSGPCCPTKDIVMPANPNSCVQCGIIKDSSGQCGCNRKCNGPCCPTKDIVMPANQSACVQCNIIKDSDAQSGSTKKYNRRPYPTKEVPKGPCQSKAKAIRKPLTKQCHCNPPIAHGNSCYKCGLPIRVQYVQYGNATVRNECCSEERLNFPRRSGPGYSTIIKPQCHCQVMGKHCHHGKSHHGMSHHDSSDDEFIRSDRLNPSLPVRSTHEHPTKKRK